MRKTIARLRWIWLRRHNPIIGVYDFGPRPAGHEGVWVRYAYIYDAADPRRPWHRWWRR